MIFVTGARQKEPTLSHSMPAIRLEKLLKSGSGNSLEKLIRRARKMDDLTTTLQAALPKDLAENLLAANVRDDAQLVLVCSSSAWASRLRFESELLIKVANEHGQAARTCRVSVAESI